MVRHDGGGSPHDLLVQSWTMYSIGVTLYLMRMFIRIRRFGWRWQPEDYIMTVAMCWYTAFNVTNIKLSTSGGGSLYLPGQFATFTPADIAMRVKNSKLEFASEQCMLNTIYWPKACMLLMYYRITSNSSHSLLVKICAVYTALGFIATELTLFLNCHPFSGYWTLPPPQEECATYFRYEVVQAVFNISSDLAILAVIIPLLWQLKMAKQDKLPLVFIFSLGFAMVICAITSKAFTFRDIFDDSYQFWYLREASCCVYICNLPYIWGFLRQELWTLRGFASKKQAGKSSNSNGRWPASTNPLGSNSGAFHHISSAARSGVDPYARIGRTESEENMIGGVGPGDVKLGEMKASDGAGGIIRTMEVHVSREASDELKR